MNKPLFAQALTTGLLAGYGGKTQFTKISRGGFKLSSSHFENDQIVYHDEWVNGGGQELVKVGGESFTRVYAGGIAKNIDQIPLTEKEIISFLISQIQKLGESTRLFSDCRRLDDEWLYEYKIITQDTDINLTVGQESIRYKNELVFRHIFVLSPVE